MNTKFYFPAFIFLPFLASAQAVPAINDFSSFDKEFGIVPKNQPEPQKAAPVQTPQPALMPEQQAKVPVPVEIKDSESISSEESEPLSTIVKEDKKLFKPKVEDKKRSSKTRKTYDYRIKPIPSVLLQKSFSENNSHIPVLTDREEYTILLYPAIQRGDLGAVRTLLERGGNINVQIEPDLLTPLSYSIIAEKNDIAKILVIRGANFNLTSVDGKTSAHFAAQKQNLSLLSFLADYGADLYKKDNTGVTPVDLISEELRARFLIDRAKSKIELNNLLSYFISTSDVTSAYMVLQKGADIEAKDSSGRTALMQAIVSSNYQMISMLLASNPALGTLANNGDNIVKLAKQRGDSSIVTLLDSAVIRKELETGMSLGLNFYETPKPEVSSTPVLKLERQEPIVIIQEKNELQNTQPETLEDIVIEEPEARQESTSGSFFERLKKSLGFEGNSVAPKGEVEVMESGNHLHENINEEPIPTLDAEDASNSIDQTRPKSIIPEALQ